MAQKCVVAESEWPDMIGGGHSSDPFCTYIWHLRAHSEYITDGMGDAVMRYTEPASRRQQQYL